MWRKAIPILFNLYILFLPTTHFGQNNTIAKDSIHIEFRISTARDSLFFEEVFLLNVTDRKDFLIFNYRTKSANSFGFVGDQECYLSSLTFDGVNQSIASNSFHAIPLPTKVEKIGISGYYLINSEKQIIQLSQNHIPKLGDFDNRAGALLDYLSYQLPSEDEIHLTINCPDNYRINGLPIELDNSYEFRGFKEGSFFIYPEGNDFRTYVQIGEIQYSIHIIGKKQAITPFKFEQLQKLVLWMDEHYGQPSDRRIVLSLKDFNQAVLNENGFKYYYKYLNFKLIEALSKHWIQSIEFANPNDLSWFRNGFIRYNQLLFLEEFNLDTHFLYPNESHPISKFLDLQDLDFKTILFYEYWMNAKIRKDIALQNSINEFSKLNYKSLSYSKSALLLKHLSSYNSKQSYDELIKESIQHPFPVDVEKLFHSHFGSENDWFYNSIQLKPTYDDYFISSSSLLNDSLHITINNKGEGQLPVKLKFIGDNKSKEIWINPFSKRYHLTLKDEGWNSIQIDPERTLIELNKRNNTHRINALKAIQNIGNIRIQPLLSLFHLKNRQIFIFPSFRWNNYDKSILGISINNRTFPLANTQYRIIPELSTSTGKLIGNFGFKSNYYPNSGLFQRLEFSTFYKKNHYDFNLEIERYSGNVKFFLPKKHAADARLRYINLKNVRISAENSPELNVQQPENYSVYSFAYHLQNRKTKLPYLLKAEMQYSASFLKYQADYRFKFKTYGPRTNNSVRFYIGKLFDQKQSNDQVPYYSIGLSNSNDYLFENLLLGRSDNSGIWSRQFFVSDGGFKTQMDTKISDFLISSNLQLNIWKNIGIYADFGFVDGIKQPFLWDSGFKLQLVDEFLELFMPIKSSERVELTQDHYFSNIRFILNLDVDDMVAKFRSSF